MQHDYAKLFRTPDDVIYVSNAGTGKIPTASIEAMKGLLEYLAVSGEPPIKEIFQKYDDLRTYAGKLLNGAPENFAYMANTTEGLSVALHSIDWQPGDNIIVQKDAFPASHYIVEYTLPKVEKRYVPVGDGAQLPERIEAQIDGKTRAIVFDWVNFLTGYRIDLAPLSALCQKHGIFSIIDGIQGAGACEIDLEATQIDFFAAGGQKWLLSPIGTGLVYVRKELLPRLKPFHLGWLSVPWPDFSSFYPLKELHPATRRFEYANGNLIGLYGFVESLKLLSSLGSSQLQSIIFQNTDYLINGLRQRNMEILVAKEHKNRSGIVTFRHPATDTNKIFKEFMSRKIFCSSREGYMRLAVHFYNTIHQMEQILQILDQVTS
ncbi:aminotransferase class V-fold PLP-dependent enzyme [candidate division KSB1 bacterium]|nr:aminotransferase class V-fold PLP-dependent enzyme [candidate division KSB1 bacterium]